MKKLNASLVISNVNKYKTDYYAEYITNLWLGFPASWQQHGIPYFKVIDWVYEYVIKPNNLITLFSSSSLFSWENVRKRM